MAIREYEKGKSNFLHMTGKNILPRLRFFRRFSGGSRLNHRLPWRATEAAELLEFALLLPLLLVMIVGLLDFATAYNLKQKLTNAAREGARMGASQVTADLDTPTPDSVQTIKDDVTAYLQNAGVNTSFIGTTMSYDPTTYTATYYTSSGGSNPTFYGLEIERRVVLYDSSNEAIFATRVTLTYPYNWTYGFNHVISMLYLYFFRAGTIPGTIGIETDAIMPNIAGG